MRKLQKPLRISFDLDDTLICYQPGALAESKPLPDFVYRWFGEPLRLGARSLMQDLRKRGCSVWIYTSSGRTAFQIRLWLRFYGVRVDGIVNEDVHRRELSGRRFSRMPSKFPPAFGIDLHVDDSEGVKMEGDEHGFRVLVIRPDDENWTERVLAAVNREAAA